MNTKVVMIISAVVMGAAGVILSFFPQEVSAYVGFNPENSIFLQLLGAVYFGFAMLNWTAKGSIIGGIYGKPVTIGNFAHFSIGGMALVKAQANGAGAIFILGCAIVYGLFALIFGYMMFTHPATPKS